MFKITSSTSSLTILQLLIDVVDKNEVGKNGGNKTNLSNLSTSKKSTGAGYLTSKGAKKGGNNPKRANGNTKKGIKAARGFNYLTPDTKKTFNYLRHVFT